MGYRCKFFALQELVGPRIFAERGEACWDMLDAKVLMTLDELRDRYGAIKINDWHNGGGFSESGARDWNTETGAKYSMHKFYRAMDCKPRNTTAEEMQRDILSHPDRFPYLTCMEDASITRTWLHIDTRNHNQPQQIWIVKP